MKSGASGFVVALKELHKNCASHNLVLPKRQHSLIFLSFLSLLPTSIAVITMVTPTTTTTETLHGGCHCGRVRFSCTVDKYTPLLECNCSRCSQLGFLHLIVPAAADFCLAPGTQEHLTEYRFNTQKAKHVFCKVCGVQSFYHPRSHPEGISVNARCLDGEVSLKKAVQAFNGRQWEAHVAEITK